MPNASAAKNFSLENDLTQSWAGYVSSVDRTLIKPNYLVRGSQNVYKTLAGTIAVRSGLKRIGAADATISPCSSEFVWNTSWGDTRVMVISDSKLWVIIEDVWYQLLSGLTKTRYVFDSWFDATEAKDRVLFVNGTDNIFHWSGGYAVIASTTSNTITKTGTTTWQQAGFSSTAGQMSILINGTTYTYTGGESTTTLTGVTADPTGEANGSSVLQSVITTASSPAVGFPADMIKVINNQAYVASYQSRLVYISSSSNFTDFTVPTPRESGDPELLTLDGTVRGIGVRQGKARIGFGTGSWATVSFSDITVGTTLTSSTTVDVIPVALNQAPYAHEFIDSTGDNLVYLALDNQVRSFGNFNNLYVAGFPSFSQEIASELSQEDFTGGGLRSIGEFVYITAPASGKAYLYQVRSSVDAGGNITAERLWHPPFVINASFIDSINGVVVAFSGVNPQVYQLWDTEQYHDDTPDDVGSAYVCIAAFGYRGTTRRQGMWNFDKLFSEGYINMGTTLNLIVNYDWEGSAQSIMQVISQPTAPAYIFNVDVASPLGNNPLGQASLGGGLIVVNGDDILPKFKAFNSVPQVNCFEYQPIIYSDLTDSRWEILAIGSNMRIDDEQNATFLVR